MTTVKEYLRANGYSPGDVITNPDNEAETYTVGKRGRAPRFLMRLAGVESKPKGKKEAKKAAGRISKAARSSGAFVTLTNGSFVINGEIIYLSEDAEVEVPAGAVISSPFCGK